MGRTSPLRTRALLPERRRALQRLTAWFLAGAVGWSSAATAKSPKALLCADPDALSPAERRQRELDNYTERSPDARATCSRCRFFSAAPQSGGCGTCQLFNGPANPRGRCDDWTAAETN